MLHWHGKGVLHPLYTDANSATLRTIAALDPDMLSFGNMVGVRCDELKRAQLKRGRHQAGSFRCVRFSVSSGVCVWEKCTPRKTDERIMIYDGVMQCKQRMLDIATPKANCVLVRREQCVISEAGKCEHVLHTEPCVRKLVMCCRPAVSSHEHYSVRQFHMHCGLVHFSNWPRRVRWLFVILTRMRVPCDILKKVARCILYSEFDIAHRLELADLNSCHVPDATGRRDIPAYST